MINALFSCYICSPAHMGNTAEPHCNFDWAGLETQDHSHKAEVKTAIFVLETRGHKSRGQGQGLKTEARVKAAMYGLKTEAGARCLIVANHFT